MCCLRCRIAGRLMKSQPGEILWEFKRDSFLELIREPLTRFGYAGSDEMTLKAFRAGKAWQMVQDGVPLSELMNAGEWATSAFASYLPKEKSAQGEPYLDREALIELSVTASDEEENFTRQSVIAMAKRMLGQEEG